MALVKCKKCKHEVTDTNLYCIHCGEYIPYTYECPECKHQIVLNDSENQNICINCGYKIDQNDINSESIEITNTIKNIGYSILVITYVISLILIIISFTSNNGITVITTLLYCGIIIFSAHISNVLLKGFSILIKNTNEIRKNTKK